MMYLYITFLKNEYSWFQIYFWLGGDREDVYIFFFLTALEFATIDNNLKCKLHFLFFFAIAFWNADVYINSDQISCKRK